MIYADYNVLYAKLISCVHFYHCNMRGHNTYELSNAHIFSGIENELTSGKTTPLSYLQV